MDWGPLRRLKSITYKNYETPCRLLTDIVKLIPNVNIRSNIDVRHLFS